MAWQVGTLLWIFRPNLKNIILVYIKRNYVNPHVNKKGIINLLINCSGVTSANTVHQVFLFFLHCYLIILLCTLLLGLHCPDTHGASMGSCPLVFPVGQLHSVKKTMSQYHWYPHQCQKSLVSGRPVRVQIECLHTVLPTRTVYRHNRIWRQMHMPTHMLKVQGRVSFYYAAKFWYLNGSWFLILLELSLVEQVHHLQLGAHHPWSLGWLTQSSWAVQFTLLWWWVWYAFQLAFGWPVDQQCILCMWH